MTAKPGDVSKASGAELAGLMTGAGAVIFAASASPNGGVDPSLQLQLSRQSHHPAVAALRVAFETRVQ